MIQVLFKRNGDGKFVSMTFEGHALSGEAGHDLVCAAVSTLAITCVNNLERMAKIQPIVEQDQEAGYLYMELPAEMSEEAAGICQILLENCWLALKEDVAKSNPQYIKVRLREK